MNIEDRARKIAEDLRDECDGSYVGAEETQFLEIEGVSVELFVCAFWEKSFWFEYTAKGDGAQQKDCVCT